MTRGDWEAVMAQREIKGARRRSNGSGAQSCRHSLVTMRMWSR